MTDLDRNLVRCWHKAAPRKRRGLLPYTVSEEAFNDARAWEYLEDEIRSRIKNYPDPLLVHGRISTQNQYGYVRVYVLLEVLN